MEDLKIYKYQADQIEDTLRMVANALKSHNKNTSLDRDIMQSLQMIKNVLDNKKILTAYEIIRLTESNQGFGFTFPHRIEKIMIEFAKMQVEKQKEEIYKKVRKVDYSNLKNCVYNAYPIDLIK